MNQEQLTDIISHFKTEGKVKEIKALGNGLINDTYKVETEDPNATDYVLQRINHSIFTDVDLLQRNIELVTTHIKQQLEADKEDNIDRKVLRFLPTDSGKTYHKAEDGTYWRMSVFIKNAHTQEAVTPEAAYNVGKTFGHFEAQLTDIADQLGETIPDFHNMELRLHQLDEALTQDLAGRKASVQDFVDEIKQYAEEMCKAEQLFREGKLPKRVCHCDSKVNNMMFDDNDNVLLVIDLDTVMPSFIFSDYGDFLRTAANTIAEDSADFDKIDFRMDIFRPFTKGYIEATRSFLLPIERDNLAYAAELFPYMQCVRFLWDYLNGDKYWKTKYSDHNLVRSRNQWALFKSAKSHEKEMQEFIADML